MKIWIKNEEWYPVRVLDVERLGIPLDVPEAKVREWSAAQAAFEHSQDEISAAITSKALVVNDLDRNANLCAHCGGPIDIRNPTGNCDHLQFPEYLTNEAKKANGLA